ncbi:MAG: hypothetical protein NTW21_35710, partial [Verrucomicrobia bacterium]|nr:hypothetical protein [Verrucomicrobiota bacterium]
IYQPSRKMLEKIECENARGPAPYRKSPVLASIKGLAEAQLFPFRNRCGLMAGASRASPFRWRLAA